MALAIARQSDVDAWQSAEPAAKRARQSWVCWRATDAAAAECGSACTPQSVCIVPELTRFAVGAALECIPREVFPRAFDTADTLAERLSHSPFLDNAHVLVHGNGKRKRGQPMRTRLNATKYAAPRRKSWSVVVSGEWIDSDEDSVVALYNYNAYGRTAQDVRCAAMPRPIFDLGVQLWLAARPYLVVESHRHPPTHCQLLFYYSLFNSSMGRHHDNYTMTTTAKFRDTFQAMQRHHWLRRFDAISLPCWLVSPA